CNRLRKYFDNPAITTDVIVGFPGETEADFAETFAYLEQVHFYEMHIFPYSRRKGTVADRMPDQIPEKVKKERSHKLLELSAKMSDEYRQSFVGREVEVLFEEPFTYENREYYVGYTKTYIKVVVPATEDFTNVILKGKITGCLTNEIFIFEPVVFSAVLE
ncbi:MAG: tRNA (N(6)-L-threonylcarbamoyladenosine(37)-C(2))-methylthiotransferase MtaB, partial [Agathobacter sp.]|nr:tRNA (N(6)-L-threonylcarbamoyladenosine(37)-C(2))-methylthiotransferase MtaB [Agathobacter sp.]